MPWLGIAVRGDEPEIADVCIFFVGRPGHRYYGPAPVRAGFGFVESAHQPYVFVRDGMWLDAGGFYLPVIVFGDDDRRYQRDQEGSGIDCAHGYSPGGGIFELQGQFTYLAVLVLIIFEQVNCPPNFALSCVTRSRSRMVNWSRFRRKPEQALS